MTALKELRAAWDAADGAEFSHDEHEASRALSRLRDAVNAVHQFEPDEPDHDIVLVVALRSAGFTVNQDRAFGPTNVAVALPDGHYVLFARGFNRADGGWEAVIEDPESAQTPLVDCPAPLGMPGFVADWAMVLCRDPLSHLA